MADNHASSNGPGIKVSVTAPGRVGASRLDVHCTDCGAQESWYVPRGTVSVEPRDVAHRERSADRVEEVDDRALRTEQPRGLVRDVLEKLAGIADGRDAGGDLAERSLRLRAADDVPSGPVQLLDQPSVRDRDRCLCGEGLCRVRRGR